MAAATPKNCDNGDDVQRARVARILRDPVAYFADARRRAHEQARRLLDEQLDTEGPAAHAGS
jgi:hypothetical protein